jgi:hypothetical protein
MDISNLTVKQIREWAGQNDIKPPSGLKKADLIRFVEGAVQERQSGVVKEAKTSNILLDRIVPVQADPNLDWHTHLMTHGWAIAPIPGWDTTYVDMFFRWFESFCPQFRRTDTSTWKTANMPVLLHGILKHHFGHTELQWQIREKCLPIFSQIWGTDNLLCSFDGGCLMKPVDRTNSLKSWIHTDQPRDYTHFACVQGVVNFVANGPADGGLVLVERSHQTFVEYMNRHPSEGLSWGKADMNDPSLSGQRLIKICAPAGHILLFDGRMFHCNVHPYNSTNYRMATYVSMQPRTGATPKELEKRIKLYETGRMTGHWCYGPYFKETAENPRSYGTPFLKPSEIEVAPLNETRRRLIGY